MLDKRLSKQRRGADEVDPDRVLKAKIVLATGLTLGRELSQGDLSAPKADRFLLWQTLERFYEELLPMLKRDIPATRRYLGSLTKAEEKQVAEFSHQVLNVPWEQAKLVLATLVDGFVGVTAQLQKLHVAYEKTAKRIEPILKRSPETVADAKRSVAIDRKAYSTLTYVGILAPNGSVANPEGEKPE